MSGIHVPLLGKWRIQDGFYKIEPKELANVEAATNKVMLLVVVSNSYEA